MTEKFDYPFDPNYLLRKKKSIRRKLIEKNNFLEKRIAILGGSTTAEVKDMLEIFLLNGGIKAIFYESEYNRYYEDAVFANAKLKEFAPDIIYLHTSGVNISRYPSFSESAEEVENLILVEMERFSNIWDCISAEYSCPIIQNNFELPYYRGLGSLDNYHINGRTRFISELNSRFSAQARQRQNMYINDINYLSAWFGLERWYEKIFWYSYKYAMNVEAIPFLSHGIASIMNAIFGQSKKCLVLDLDNTLWGGVIGDDGLNNIRIGKENPEAEAYCEFQQYVKNLKDRGVILAVCSKNDEKNAREGFAHPDSILCIDDFSDFCANWDPKYENIRNSAKKINIGLDSIVFVDDNPAERDAVRSQEPQVAVPELGNNVSKYINILDKSGFFEAISLSSDDLLRNDFYQNNVSRDAAKSRYENHDDFLYSLKMVAEIKQITPIYLNRATQLINKTNQFNLTGRRYAATEVDLISKSPNYIALYGRLQDKFGDNGLVSIMIAAIRGDDLHIDAWLMSCRVLGRNMEYAMFDRLVMQATEVGLKSIIGHYYKTEKNNIVSNLFRKMGFQCVVVGGLPSSCWRLDISEAYTCKNNLIEVIK